MISTKMIRDFMFGVTLMNAPVRSKLSVPYIRINIGIIKISILPMKEI